MTASQDKRKPFDRYLGTRVRSARLGAALTQQGLATLIGVTLATVNKYEQGEISLTCDKLALIAHYVRKTPGWFFDGWNVQRGAPVSDSVESALMNMDNASVALAVRFRRLPAAHRTLVSMLMDALDGGAFHEDIKELVPPPAQGRARGAA
jgi:transcriptional regulator with XRE-family HTH domain